MTDKPSRLKQIALFDVFPFLCRFIGFALLLCAMWTIGLPPRENVPTSVWLEGTAACFFLLLPSAKKISVGKLLTFEREVEKIKEETKETRETMMSFLSVYSSMIATISTTVSQTVNLSFNPAQQQRDDANEKIRDVEDDAEPKEDEVETFVAASGGDYNFALARVRIEMERALQDYVDSPSWSATQRIYATPTAYWTKRPFASIGNLFENFLSKNPHLKSLRTPFQYVLSMCNAAIHGRRVEDDVAREGISMGLIIIQQITDAKTPSDENEGEGQSEPG